MSGLPQPAMFSVNARWRAWWPLLCAALAGGAQAVALAWPWGVTESDWLVQRPGWLALVWPAAGQPWPLLQVVAMAVLALGMLRRISRQLGGEPQYAAEIANGIASGNLSHRIEVLGGAEESLLGSMRRMQDGLRGMVERFNLASAQLKTSASELTQEMEQVGRGARMSAEATSSTAAAVEQMTVSVSNAESAMQDAEAANFEFESIATQIGQQAQRGDMIAAAAEQQSHVASQVTDSLVVIRDAVEETEHVVRELSQASQSLHHEAQTLENMVNSYQL